MIRRAIEKVDWPTFCQRMIALIGTTCCVIAVLLVTANDPSSAEVTRGGTAGVIGYFAARMFGPWRT